MAAFLSQHGRKLIILLPILWLLSFLPRHCWNYCKSHSQQHGAAFLPMTRSGLLMKMDLVIILTGKTTFSFMNIHKIILALPSIAFDWRFSQH